MGKTKNSMVLWAIASLTGLIGALCLITGVLFVIFNHEQTGKVFLLRAAAVLAVTAIEICGAIEFDDMPRAEKNKAWRRLGGWLLDSFLSELPCGCSIFFCVFTCDAIALYIFAIGFLITGSYQGFLALFVVASINGCISVGSLFLFRATYRLQPKPQSIHGWIWQMIKYPLVYHHGFRRHPMA